MKKRCLFIDDNPDDVVSVLENLAYNGKLKGLEITCDLFGLETGYYDDSDNLDREKIKKKLHDNLLESQIYDLVVCDFDVEDSNLNGIDIASLVREKNRSCAIAIYSGNLDKVAGHIAGQKEVKEQIRRIKKLVNCKIAFFIDRSTEFESDLIHILEKGIPLEVIITKKLEEHGELQFQHGYSTFVGKSLKEISHEIKMQSPHGNIFKEEIIERGIANMIELNKPD